MNACAGGLLACAVLTAWAQPSPRAIDAAIRHGEILATQGDSARGVQACVSCHSAPHLSLAGRPQNELAATLRALQASARTACPALQMSMIAKRLGPAEIEALAAYYAQRQATP